MMTRQARSSAVIMGLNTHMILEAVPARLRYTATCIRPSTGHHATMPGPCHKRPRRGARRRGPVPPLVSGQWSAATFTPKLAGPTWRFFVERVTGIELALSAWEVCGAPRVLPAESVTCGDLDGVSASDRDYPWALLPSGTQRARVHPRIKRRARPRSKASGSVRAVGSSCDTTAGSMWRRPRWCSGVAARVAAPWPSAWGSLVIRPLIRPDQRVRMSVGYRH